MRALVALSLLVALARAPMQCASRRPAELEREESPGEALWLLSERFAAQGNTAAREATLRFLVERYPSSRFAVQAREALQSSGSDGR
jgi:outer membrane protein assembly factor BamD (BamD/ComL family)